MKDILKNPIGILLICLTLGLAPFAPEPHIWGKLKWIAGGGEGMQFMDWFDVVLHGAPWVLLLASLVMKLKSGSSVSES